jgi:hypothetical protein
VAYRENSLLNAAGNFFSISGNLNHESGNYQTRSGISSLLQSELNHGASNINGHPDCFGIQQSTARFYSSFLLVMHKSDQRKNEMCGLLTPPTTIQWWAVV